MATQTVLGKVSGAIDAIQQPVTVYDDGGSALTESAAVTAAQTAAPSSFFGVAQDPTPSIQRIAPHAVEVTIQYRYSELNSLQRPAKPDTGSLVRRASFRAQSKRDSWFLSKGRVYDDTGNADTPTASTNVTSTHGKLAWRLNGDEIPIVGQAPPDNIIDPLPETRTLTYYAPNAIVDDTYLDAIEAVMGHFNSTTFRGRDAGTVRLVRFDCNERSADDWELSFGFGHKAKRAYVALSNDVVVPDVYAYEHVWLLDTQIFDDSINLVASYPFRGIVGPVWDLSDLATILNLPA